MSRKKSRAKRRAARGRAVPPCGDCKGPIGAYEIRCSFCESDLPAEQVESRVERLLTAYAALLRDAHLTPDVVMVAVLAGGLGMACAAIAAAIGVPFSFIVLAGLVVMGVFGTAMVWSARRLRAHRVASVYRQALEPLLLDFIEEREVPPPLVREVARRSLRGSLMLPLLEETLADR